MQCCGCTALNAADISGHSAIAGLLMQAGAVQSQACVGHIAGAMSVDDLRCGRPNLSMNIMSSASFSVMLFDGAVPYLAPALVNQW